MIPALKKTMIALTIIIKQKKEAIFITRRAGFSLIDLLIASTLVLILLLGLAQILLYSRLSSFHSDSRLQSTILASRQMERIRPFSFSDADLQNGSLFSTILPDGLERPFLLQWNIREESPDLKAITLECYPKGRPEKAVRLFLYLHRRLGY